MCSDPHRTSLISVLALLLVTAMVPLDFQQTDFILWASVYVLLKWTVGVWAFRRAKAYFASRRQPQGV
jgi:hypothetical protein